MKTERMTRPSTGIIKLRKKERIAREAKARENNGAIWEERFQDLKSRAEKVFMGVGIVGLSLLLILICMDETAMSPETYESWRTVLGIGGGTMSLVSLLGNWVTDPGEE